MLNLFKNHIYTIFFLRILLVKVVFSNHHLWLFRADFQKECGFWVDWGLISSKTRFLLRILLVKVVFSNHHFQIWLFRQQIYRFPKGKWFLNRFRLNLLQNHVPFENSAREGGFSPITFSNHHFQIWLFRADFQKECGFWVDLGLISSNTTFLLRILLMKVIFSNHFLKSPFSNLDFSEPISKKNVVFE